MKKTLYVIISFLVIVLYLVCNYSDDFSTTETTVFNMNKKTYGPPPPNGFIRQTFKIDDDEKN